MSSRKLQSSKNWYKLIWNIEKCLRRYKIFFWLISTDHTYFYTFPKNYQAIRRADLSKLKEISTYHRWSKGLIRFRWNFVNFKLFWTKIYVFPILILIGISQCDLWAFLSSKQNSVNKYFSRQPNTANLAISASSMSVNKV